MLAAFSITANGNSATDSHHDTVADVVQVVRESGLPNRTDSMFTTVEGDWDDIFAMLRQAVEAAQAHGTRVTLNLKADIRPGYTGELDGKLERLEAAIAERTKP